MSLSLSQWLELLESRHSKSIDLGLERSLQVWQRMGSPRPAARIVTVAGTNGKGSTVAYLCAMLQGLGRSCGSYTTPHLLHYNERIQINGVCADDRQLVSAFERVEAAREETSLTYFEFGTLAAFSIMAENTLDFAVLEVGLGGRLDAVNILDADCTVITPVGLDHQEYLGVDRESIGREKAGIIRRHIPLVCGEADPPDSVLAAAGRAQAPVFRLGREFDARLLDESVCFTKGAISWTLPVPMMAGRHQVNNMVTAVAALLELGPEFTAERKSLVNSLEAVTVNGRMQQLSRHPQVLIDVGHNPLAAGVIAQAMSASLRENPGRSCRCVIGMLGDKDASGVAEILGPVISNWYCAGLQGERGQSGKELAATIAAAAPGADVTAWPDVVTAFDFALGESRREDCILVFGSFLTAAAALKHWQTLKEDGVPFISPANAV